MRSEGSPSPLALDVVERESQDGGELVHESRLERRKPVLRQADERGGDRLVRAAFGRERDAGRRRDEDEARILITGIVERIEPARDERIVQRADRESRSPLIACDRPSAESRMNRFISAMPSSMCWPLGEKSQLKVEGMRSLLKVSAMLLAREQAAPIDPGAEIGRDRHVRRGRDNAVGDLDVAAAELVEQRAEAGLRRYHGWNRDRELRRHRDARRP